MLIYKNVQKISQKWACVGCLGVECVPGVPWSRVHWHWSCIPGVPECPLKSQEEPVWSAGARCARQCHSSACSDHMGTAGQGKAGARGALTLHARTGGAQAPHTRPTMASPQCSDYRQVALPRPKRDPDLFESSTKSRVAGVVALKVLDLAVHLYTMAVSSFSLHLAVIHLHQVTQTIPYTYHYEQIIVDLVYLQQQV